MKKKFALAIGVLLFSFVTVSCYGQTQSENRWLLGSWSGNSSNGFTLEIVLNNNGTGTCNIKLQGSDGYTGDILFSVSKDDIMRIYDSSGHNRIANVTLRRINDQRMVIIVGGVEGYRDIQFNMNKRN
jgi:hypothetical protein